MDARKTIPAFDAYLAVRGLHFHATIVGGAALQLMGVIARATKDCDVLAPTLPAPILRAANEFAALHTSEVDQGWLNNGPVKLIADLPEAWSMRLQRLYAGDALELFTLSREDLLRTKLFALVDRNIDLPDCVALRPTRAELQALLPWLDERDSNTDWPSYVRTVLAGLAKELGYEL